MRRFLSVVPPVFEGVRRRLAPEEGIALVMALGLLIVLSVTTISLLTYTSSSARSVRIVNGSLNASNLAEAGMNEAMSVILTSGTSAIKQQPGYAGDTNSTVSSYNGGGTATWGGTLDPSTGQWTVKSIGSMKNPTGAAALTRTLYAVVQPTGPPPPYSFASLGSSCDKHQFVIRASGQLTVTNAIYVNSCDNRHDGFDIFGPGGSLSAPAINTVGGWETHDGDTVKVNGVNCPLLSANPPATPTAGCPTVGSAVLTDPFAGKVAAPALGTPMCTAPVYGAAASYSPKQTLSANITSSQTSFTLSGTSVANGDMIVVDTEDMLVTAGGGTSTITVTRAANGTTAAAHTKGKEAKKLPVTGTSGTAASPAACDISTGTVTLNPGTYYGGICIGASPGTDCGSNIGGLCNTADTGNANVTLNPGTYIMAGGGFFVCGAASLSAPDVLIYNTKDPTNGTGSGAIDQVLLSTTGAVTLGPQNTGQYAGLTIFEDSTTSVVPTADCGAKSSYSTTPSQTLINEWDIALMSMASTGANGPLGSVSGTIYAPGPYAMFADGVSGTANIAVMSHCIVIDGGNATFAYQQQGLYGTGATVVRQWG